VWIQFDYEDKRPMSIDLYTRSEVPKVCRCCGVKRFRRDFPWLDKKSRLRQETCKRCRREQTRLRCAGPGVPYKCKVCTHKKPPEEYEWKQFDNISLPSDCCKSCAEVVKEAGVDVRDYQVCMKCGEIKLQMENFGYRMWNNNAKNPTFHASCRSCYEH